MGRERELARLKELFAQALGGVSRLVVVSGEAGLGKTTLVESFLASEPARSGIGLTVARGACVEQHGAGEAYMPLLDALGRLCDDDARLVRVLASRAPMWLMQLPRLVGDAERESLERRVIGANPARMLREGVNVLLTLAARNPLLLVLEDLHWSDASTVDVLAALARRQEPAPLMILVTLRADDAATGEHAANGLVRDLRPRGVLEEVALTPLAPEDVEGYVTRRLPGAELPAGAARLLVARSRGNPLYLEKAVNAWVEAGHLREEGGAWRLDADADVLAAEIPESLRELIRDRVRHVPDEHRSLVESAAVVGPEFSAALVAAAVARPVDEAEDGLERLARAGLLLAPRGIEAWPDGTVASRYGFTHDLCHEVLYEELTAGRRARLHLRVAGRLEDAYGRRRDEVSAELATHFTRGGDGARAVPHVLATARRAAGRHAHREALESARAGLRLLDHLPPGRDRDEAELGFQGVVGPALIGTEGWTSEGGEKAFTRSRTLAEALGRTEEIGWSVHKLATVYEVRGEYARSESLLEEAFAVLDDEAMPGLSVDSNELMACSLFHQGVFGRALETAERGLAAYDGVYENLMTAGFGESPGVACHVWAVHSLWFLGRDDEALARARRALDLSERLGGAHARGFAHAQIALLSCMRNDPDAARLHAEAAIDASRLGGFHYRTAMGLVARGWALAARADYDEGIAELRRGIQLSRATGARMDDAFYLGLLADACARAGWGDEALAALEEARAEVPRGGRFFWEAELSRLRGELLVRAGRYQEGEDELRRAVETARGQGSPMLERRARTTLARVMRATGRSDEAAALLPPEPPSAPPPAPAVRYARSGALNIAYEVTGSGPPDLVLVPGFVSHLTMDRAEPRHARFLDRLGAFSRLIRFDKRGTGLSDRPPGLPDLETRMDDVRAVMDAAGSRRAVLLGYSEGGPLSVLFAATHPERVAALVLVNSYAKRVDPDPDYPWAVPREARLRSTEQLEDDWGYEAHGAALLPTGDEAMRRWWAERCRAAASPGSARALSEMNSLIDVRDVLIAIRVPTLVVHRTGDMRVVVGHGRYLAEQIRGARLVEIPGVDHFVGVDPDQIVDQIEPWVRELPPDTAPTPDGPPVLATILAAGDAADDPVVHEEVARHRGRFSEGVALFDGPTRAIRCGLAVARRDPTARLGVHTGEVSGGRGPAVAVARSAAVAAQAGEVLVTATTRDLVPGSGLGFRHDDGRDLEGERRVYAAVDTGDDARGAEPSSTEAPTRTVPGG